MGYVGMEITGARRLGQDITGTSVGAGQMRQQVLGALAVAGLDSVAPSLLARVQDGLAGLAETIAGRAAAADRFNVPATPLPDWLGPMESTFDVNPLRQLTAASQTLDSASVSSLATVLAQGPIPDAGAPTTMLAGPAETALRLPDTPEGAVDFLAEVRARFDRAPNEPIRFEDNGVSVTILNNPKGFAVVRQPGQSLTQSINDRDTPAFDVVIDGEQAGAVPDTWVNKKLLRAQSTIGPVDLSDVEAHGMVVDDGDHVAGRSSPKTFYLALDTPDPADAGAPGTGWRIGAGDPPPDAHLAFGGGIPVIINGLPYGATNLYLPGAPPNLPVKDDPGPGNTQFLAQRSNTAFGLQDAGGPSQGRAVTGLGPDGTVYILVQPDGGSGATLSSLRDMLGRVGVRDAVSWDGSDSALQVVDGDVLIPPGRAKNNYLPVAIGFSVPFSEQGLTHWVADRVPGTSLSFATSPFETPLATPLETPSNTPFGRAGTSDGGAWDVSRSVAYYGGTPAESAPLPPFGDGDFGAIDLRQFDQAPTFTTSDVLSAYASGNVPSTDFDAVTDFADYDFGQYDTGIYDPGTYDVGDF